jgi:hypothetical protein
LLIVCFRHSLCEVTEMAQELMASNYATTADQINTGALMLGAGLALTSMILVPALAMRFGLSASLTGALRIAIMKASSRATTVKPITNSQQRLLR